MAIGSSSDRVRTVMTPAMQATEPERDHQRQTVAQDVGARMGKSEHDSLPHHRRPASRSPADQPRNAPR